MAFKLSKKTTYLYLTTGILTIALGIIITMPMPYNWEAVTEQMSPVLDTWWRGLVLFFAGSAIAFFLARSGRVATAEYIGTLACMVLLFPLLGLLAGIPDSVGLRTLPLVFGGLTTITSASALMAIFILQLAPIDCESVDKAVSYTHLTLPTILRV